jgi:hypothetical protein
MSEEHTGELLFHCWPHEDRASAYAVFQSILQRGFLLTINSAGLDSFQYFSNGAVRTIDVMQRARLCFTEIPAHLLYTHKYGHFGLGFKRKTIIDWGGCPAWYLPNHPGKESLKETGAELVRGLHSSAQDVGHFRVLSQILPQQLKQHIPEAYLSRDFEIKVKFAHGPELSGAVLEKALGRDMESLYYAISFVKELSPRDVEDYRYLYEREWRIVDGIGFKGVPVCRQLTAAEVSELCAAKPDWSEPLKSADINVQVRFPNSKIIDLFRFFNGLPSATVAQMVDTILVPDGSAKAYVKRYIERNRSQFGAKPPRVRIFPNTVFRRFVWSAGRLLQTLFPPK